MTWDFPPSPLYQLDPEVSADAVGKGRYRIASGLGFPFAERGACDGPALLSILKVKRGAEIHKIDCYGRH
jgi:hypothetical protein